MKLIGKITKGIYIYRTEYVENEEPNIIYTDLLEKCLIDLCKKMEISVPMWLDKNTKEFVRYRRTFFSKEQFFEEVNFDNFEIRVE